MLDTGLATWADFEWSLDPVQGLRTSNHDVDGRGCQYQQVFFDDRGQCHYDHVYATELFSNRSMRPAHDFVMASEYVEVARIHRALREVPPRYLVALKTDCLMPGTGKTELAICWTGWWSRRSRSSTSGCGPTSPSSPRTAGSGFCCSGSFDSYRQSRTPSAGPRCCGR